MSASQGKNGGCLIAEVVPRELLLLQPLSENNVHLAEQEKLLHFPRIATKNNLLKLNWWHSPAQQVDVEASFLSSTRLNIDANGTNTKPSNITNNNNTANQSSLNTPVKSIHMSKQNHAIAKQMNERLSPNSDPDEDCHLQNSQLLMKGR